MNKVICSKCEGTGIQKELRIVWIPGYSFKGGVSYKCIKCHGNGTLEWIDNILGKKGPINYSEKDVIEIEYDDFPWYLLKGGENVREKGRLRYLPKM